MRKRLWLTRDQEIMIVKRYVAGESPPAIARTLEVCANNVRGALRRNNVAIRDRTEARVRFSHRKDAFDTLTPESMYWIGFLFADGSIYFGKIGAPVISIGLAARDRIHLERFRQFLHSKHAIGNGIGKIRGKLHPNVRFGIRSTRLSDALTKYGMRAKSLDRIATTELASSRDFWRGVVDGDGFVGIVKDRRTRDRVRERARLGLCGGLPLMQQFKKFLESRNIATRTSIRPQKKIFVITLVGSTALAAIRLLYDDAEIALERKMTRVRNILTPH